jgi:hypothetical protein
VRLEAEVPLERASQNKSYAQTLLIERSYPMTLTELSIIVLALSGLALVRFGLPLFFMWLFNQFCYRVLHVTHS